MRPVNATLLSPAWPVRVSLAIVMVRVQRGLRRSLRESGLHARPTRRPRALVWIAICTMAGWSRRKENTVPFLWRVAAVRPDSVVEEPPTRNTELVSRRAVIVALVAAEGVPTVCGALVWALEPAWFVAMPRQR